MWFGGQSVPGFSVRHTFGGLVSPLTTVTVKVIVRVLPRVSEAVHVTVVVPIGKKLPDAGTQVTGRTPSTRSTAVGGGQVTNAPAPVPGTVMLPKPVITGGVVSTTMTWNEAEPVLLWESVAVQVTVVSTSGNMLPDAGAQVGVMLPSTMSNAVAVNVTTAPPGPVASRGDGAGHGDHGSPGVHHGHVERGGARVAVGIRRRAGDGGGLRAGTCCPTAARRSG